MSALTGRETARVTAAVRRTGLTPITPYPGNQSAPWPVDCARCGTQGLVTRWQLLRQGCDPCPTCAREKTAARVQATRRKHS